MATLKSLSVENDATAATAPATSTGIARKAEVDALGALASVPATPSSTGTAGQKAADGAYDYLCRATNTWVRGPAISGWSAVTVPSVGKMHMTIGGSGVWNEVVLTLANDSLLGIDGSGNPQVVSKSTFATASSVAAHIADTANPHGVTKAQVGLGNVTNVEQLPMSYLDTDGTMAADSDVKVPTQRAVRTLVSATIVGVLKLIGDIDCSGNPNYPSAVKGSCYMVSVAGRVGGVSGKVVGIGDQVICKADNAGGSEASVGTSWFVLEANIPGMTTIGANLITLANPGAITFPRFNADNSVDALNAAAMLAALGAAASARTLTAAGLVTGGGDLSSNRTFTVTEASQAQARDTTNAASQAVVITPLRLRDALNNPPVTTSYTNALTLNCNDGLSRIMTMSGDATVHPMANGAGGMRMTLYLLASGGDRTVTISSSIAWPSAAVDAGFTGDIIIGNGQLQILRFEYSSALAKWMLLTSVGGYA